MLIQAAKINSINEAPDSNKIVTNATGFFNRYSKEILTGK